jgi:hypothetical protein
MVDLAAKVKAIHELTDAWAASGDVELIDAALAILLLRSDSPKASPKAVPEAPARRKRGPYKQQQWYRALLQGAAPLEEIVKRALALEPDCVPGETMTDKMKFVAKMRTSPSRLSGVRGWLVGNSTSPRPVSSASPVPLCAV